MSKDGGIVAALKELRTFFNPSEHALRLFTVYWIPRHQVITTKGQVSRRGGDIDNYLKLTTDFLCNSKYIGHNFDRCDHPPIVNLGIDDQYIIDYDTSKRISPNDEYHIDFHIEILPLADFKEHSFEVVDNVSHYDQTDSEWLNELHLTPKNPILQSYF